jgi:DNA polymerase type B, organellar and viral
MPISSLGNVLDDKDLEDYAEMESDVSADDISIVDTSEIMYHEWTPVSHHDVSSCRIEEYTTSSISQIHYNEDPNVFVHDLMVMTRRVEADYFNIMATVKDVETHEESQIRLRFSTDDQEQIESIAECISTNIANSFKDGKVNSDNVSGKMVIWHLDWIQLISNKSGSNVVTVIVGESTCFPGYETAVINISDHNVIYSDNDCIFMCMNEALSVRLQPLEVRKALFPDIVNRGLVPINLLHVGHLKKIARIYGCVITLHDIDSNKKLMTERIESLKMVNIVKMGSAIGLITRKRVEKDEFHKFDQLGNVGHAFYDFETVSDEKVTSSYGLGVFWEDNTFTTLLHDDPLILGDTVVNEFDQHLKKSKCDIIYLHAWNGSRFDHRLLISVLEKRFKVGFMIMNNSGEILTVDIRAHGKKFILRDPCKMFPSTLEEAARFSGLSYSKLEINHDEIEEAYVAGSLERYLRENRDRIMEYIKRDVELLRDVTYKLMELYNSEGINYNGSITRNAATYIGWKTTLNKQQMLALKNVMYMSGDTLKFSHRNVTIDEVKINAIAGRVQAISGSYENVALLDYKSMYPSVCITELFPGGESVATSRYLPHSVGLYDVEVRKQTYPHVVPFRYKKSSYDWNSNNVIRKILTNIDVECLIESGAELKIFGGICWLEPVRYFDSYMNSTIHKRQNSEPHTIMNEHYKAMANSLTGSLFQDIKREYIKFFVSEAEYVSYVKQYNKYVSIVGEHRYQGGHIMVFFYPKKLSNENDVKIQRQECSNAFGSKPAILTMFIYAYARAKLWRMWKHIEDNNLGKVVYCDTDSLMIVKHCDLFQHLKRFIGQSVGMLEIQRDNNSAVVISAKVYAMRGTNIEDRVRCKTISHKASCLNFSTLEEVKELKLRLDSELLSGSVSSKWSNVREMLRFLQSKQVTSVTYEKLLGVLHGEIMVAVYWNFEKKLDSLSKRYVTKTIKL